MATIASTKRKMNQGMETLPEPSRNTNIVANARGIIHRARVSLMSVAICRASSPYTSPAPTTLEVSCMAMAAHVPNWAWLMSNRWPRGGKMNRATALRMKMTPRLTAISFSSARSTGPTAAMALPPQMAVPLLMRYDVLRLRRMA